MNTSPIDWRIGPEPVTLTPEEFWARYSHVHMPEKFESSKGMLFWSDEQRLHVLGMLLESIGVRRALALCSPEVIRAALTNSESND